MSTALLPLHFLPERDPIRRTLCRQPLTTLWREVRAVIGNLLRDPLTLDFLLALKSNPKHKMEATLLETRSQVETPSSCQEFHVDVSEVPRTTPSPAQPMLHLTDLELTKKN